MTLADTGLADKDEIGLPADEVAAGELFDLQPVNLWIELPVKGLQNLAFLKLGFTNTALDGAVPVGRGLLAEQQIDEHQMGQSFFSGAIENGVELGGRDRYSEDFEVAQAEIANRSRRCGFLHCDSFLGESSPGGRSSLESISSV